MAIAMQMTHIAEQIIQERNRLDKTNTIRLACTYKIDVTRKYLPLLVAQCHIAAYTCIHIYTHIHTDLGTLLDLLGGFMRSDAFTFMILARCSNTKLVCS